MENGDFPLELNSPPTAPEKVGSFTSKSDRNEDPDNYISPRMPMDDVFEPLAPGPDRMILAPHDRKYCDKARESIARILDFTSSFKALQNRTCDTDPDTFTDEEMFEWVYGNLLEVIVSNQAESALAEMPDTEWDSEACKTPPPVPQLNELAETCPNAPMKPTGKSRIVKLGFCRKLEF